MRAFGLILLSALPLAACTGDELRFREDDRLRFTAPAEGAEARGPVRISWQMRGFRPTGRDGSTAPDRGLFGVFVDRSPMAPGEDVDSLADEDPLCQRLPRCPDEAWLADRGVHLVAAPEVRLAALPAGRGRPAGDRRRHRVTVVLLDGRGRRIGESAWSLRLFAPEDG